MGFLGAVRFSDSGEAEVKGWRINRGSMSIRLTNLEGAGKRGKRVEVMTMFSLRVEVTDALVDAVVAMVKRAKDVADVRAGLIALAAQNGMEFEEYEDRGIDVRPAGAGPIRIRGENVSVHATLEHFGVQDAHDFQNRTTFMQVTKADARKFYDWASKHKGLLETASFSQIKNAVEGAGIKIRIFSAMD